MWKYFWCSRNLPTSHGVKTNFECWYKRLYSLYTLTRYSPNVLVSVAEWSLLIVMMTCLRVKVSDWSCSKYRTKLNQSQLVEFVESRVDRGGDVQLVHGHRDCWRGGLLHDHCGHWLDHCQGLYELVGWLSCFGWIYAELEQFIKCDYTSTFQNHGVTWKC